MAFTLMTSKPRSEHQAKNRIVSRMQAALVFLFGMVAPKNSKKVSRVRGVAVASAADIATNGTDAFAIVGESWDFAGFSEIGKSDVS